MESLSIKTLGKLVSVLDCFSTTDRSLSVSEIARRVELPRSTSHRLILSLKEVGFLEQEHTRQEYRLGLRLFQLGTTVLANMDLQREARPLIEALSSITGENSHLCVFDGERMVFVERSTGGPTGAQNDMIIMEISPCYCTGVGKATLAFQSDSVIDRVIAGGLQTFTAHTLTDPDALRADLLAVKQRGYAYDRQEHKMGVSCVAAPIRNTTGRVIAAISASGPTKKMTDAELERLAPYVVGHANAISRRLGFVAPTEAA